MRKSILISLLIYTSIVLFAQHPEDSVGTRPLTNIYLGLLGDASLISFNYDRFLEVHPNFIISSKLGLGYNEEFQFCILGPCTSEKKKVLTVPHHITANFGKGSHFIEFGIGGAIVIGNTTQPYLMYPMIGYRLSPLKSNMNTFRIFAQMPLSGLITDDIIFIPIGLNFGKSF